MRGCESSASFSKLQDALSEIPFWGRARSLLFVQLHVMHAAIPLSVSNYTCHKLTIALPRGVVPTGSSERLGCLLFVRVVLSGLFYTLLVQATLGVGCAYRAPGHA